MIDYSECFIEMGILQRKAHEAFLRKDIAEAAELTYELMACIRKLQLVAIDLKEQQA